jgi:hypothetical protein
MRHLAADPVRQLNFRILILEFNFCNGYTLKDSVIFINDPFMDSMQNVKPPLLYPEYPAEVEKVFSFCHRYLEFVLCSQTARSFGFHGKCRTIFKARTRTFLSADAAINPSRRNSVFPHDARQSSLVTRNLRSISNVMLHFVLFAPSPRQILA